MSIYSNHGFYLLLIAFLFAMRFMASQLIKKQDFKVRLALGIGLFVGYLVLLQVYIYYIYQNLLTPEMTVSQTYPFIAVALLAFHLAVLLIGIVYYLIQGRRKISDLEKMKLKDL